MEEDIKELFIIDASYILAALMPDEQDGHAIETLIKYQNDKIYLAAPTLLSYEVANSMRNSIRRKRIPENIAVKLLEEFKKLEIQYYPVGELTIFEIACTHNISCYDAAYVALAREKHATLLTYDERLRE